MRFSGSPLPLSSDCGTVTAPFAEPCALCGVPTTATGNGAEKTQNGARQAEPQSQDLAVKVSQ